MGMNSRAFQKSWYLKLNDPTANRALWLRFNFLFSTNGFKKMGETWAIFFYRDSALEVKKMSIKQIFEALPPPDLNSPQVKIGECELDDHQTRGTIQSKGHQVQWDLKIEKGLPASFNVFPEVLLKTGMIQSTLFTPYEELFFTGTLQIGNQEPVVWNRTPGMQSSTFGPKYPRAWAWSHCNSFSDDQGNPVRFLFEGVAMRTHFGPVTGPALSSFYFHYCDQAYFLITSVKSFH